jgi:hypothetical protein
MTNAATTLRKVFDQWKRERATASAYKRVFESPEGEIVLRDLITEGGLLSVSHVSGDSHDTAFNDGKRALALHIFQRLRWSEPELVKIASENIGITSEVEPQAEAA